MPIKHKQSKTVAEKRKKFQTVINGESETQQHLKSQCCVNNIMAKFRKTGLIDHVKTHNGRYEDVASVQDFQTAMNVVAQAQQSFEQLPSEIRKEFGNDPKQFLEFVHNPDNSDKLIDMGLKNPPVADETTVVDSAAPETQAEATTETPPVA